MGLAQHVDSAGGLRPTKWKAAKRSRRRDAGRVDALMHEEHLGLILIKEVALQAQVRVFDPPR